MAETCTPSARPARWKWILAAASLVVITAATVVGGLRFAEAVQAAQEAARSSNCRGHLKGVIVAWHDRHDSLGRFPPLVEAENAPPRSWRVELLPWLEQRDLRARYVESAEWDAPPNLPIARTEMPLYRCPSNRAPTRADGLWFTAYAAVRGPETLFPEGRGLSLDEVARADGTANTIAVLEACAGQIVWTEPRDLDWSAPEALAEILNILSAGPHPQGVNAAFVDGSVRTLSPRIEPRLLKALLTATGGEEPLPHGRDAVQP